MIKLIIEYIQCYWIPFTLGILTGISWGYYEHEVKDKSWRR